ncbi:hypothetical protein B0H17DRAFT_1141279, partial [Mycena rosella]
PKYGERDPVARCGPKLFTNYSQGSSVFAEIGHRKNISHRTSCPQRPVPSHVVEIGAINLVQREINQEGDPRLWRGQHDVQGVGKRGQGIASKSGPRTTYVSSHSKAFGFKPTDDGAQRNLGSHRAESDAVVSEEPMEARDQDARRKPLTATAGPPPPSSASDHGTHSKMTNPHSVDELTRKSALVEPPESRIELRLGSSDVPGRASSPTQNRGSGSGSDFLVNPGSDPGLLVYPQLRFDSSFQVHMLQYKSSHLEQFPPGHRMAKTTRFNIF